MPAEVPFGRGMPGAARASAKPGTIDVTVRRWAEFGDIGYLDARPPCSQKADNALIAEQLTGRTLCQRFALHASPVRRSAAEQVRGVARVDDRR